MSMINPDYYLHKEISELWAKIHSLRDRIIFLNDLNEDNKELIEKQKKEIKILKLQLETINHPLKKWPHTNVKKLSSQSIVIMRN